MIIQIESYWQEGEEHTDTCTAYPSVAWRVVEKIYTQRKHETYTIQITWWKPDGKIRSQYTLDCKTGNLVLQYGQAVANIPAACQRIIEKSEVK